MSGKANGEGRVKRPSLPRIPKPTLNRLIQAHDEKAREHDTRELEKLMRDNRASGF